MFWVFDSYCDEQNNLYSQFYNIFGILFTQRCGLPTFSCTYLTCDLGYIKTTEYESVEFSMDINSGVLSSILKVSQEKVCSNIYLELVMYMFISVNTLRLHYCMIIVFLAITTGTHFKSSRKIILFYWLQHLYLR